jgi:hypothetical protein
VSAAARLPQLAVWIFFIGCVSAHPFHGEPGSLRYKLSPVAMTGFPFSDCFPSPFDVLPMLLFSLTARCDPRLNDHGATARATFLQRTPLDEPFPAANALTRRVAQLAAQRVGEQH